MAHSTQDTVFLLCLICEVKEISCKPEQTLLTVDEGDTNLQSDH